MSGYSIMVEHGRERAARVAPNPYNLTTREKDVAAWLGRGLDCAAIAGKLSIGQRSVATHITRISMKLGARNAAHLSLIIHTMPGLPVEQPTLVIIEDFRAAFGMGWVSETDSAEVTFAD
ncbi:MAG: helix-turn-helix domain-containing protein [Devosia sp.]